MLRRYFLCLLCWAIAGCSVKKNAPQVPRLAEERPAAVVFLVGEGRPSPAVVTVEVARTRAEQDQGLMFRTFLGEGAGMLFVFPTTELHRFWMHNTYIPLDMIFLDANQMVVAVVEQARPLDDTVIDPGVLSRYVLEVPSGYAARQHIRPGTRATFHGIQD